MGITDEMLMAYADGQLTTEEAAKVDRAMTEDPALAEKVALMADARRAVQAAYRNAPPVPEALAARVQGLVIADAERRSMPDASNVVDLAARRRMVPIWQLPIAAALALAVGAGSVWLASQPGGEAAGVQVAVLTDPAVEAALATLPSGEAVDLGNGARLLPIATFRDESDQLCREFEHDQSGRTVVAVACRTDQAWDVRFAIASAAADAGGYAPASSLETLDAYMTATGAGAPLSAADEAAALQSLD
jgi:anti-sigma factor RsiW